MYLHVSHSVFRRGIFHSQPVNFFSQLQLAISDFLAFIQFSVDTLLSQCLIVEPFDKLPFRFSSNLTLMRHLCSTLPVFIPSLKGWYIASDKAFHFHQIFYLLYCCFAILFSHPGNDEIIPPTFLFYSMILFPSIILPLQQSLFLSMFARFCMTTTDHFFSISHNLSLRSAIAFTILLHCQSAVLSLNSKTLRGSLHRQHFPSYCCSHYTFN